MPRLLTLPALLPMVLVAAMPLAGADTLTEHQLPMAPLQPFELQACLQQREHIARAEGELEVRRMALQHERVEIEQLSEALDVRLGELERQRPAAVAAFQVEMLQRDRRVAAHVDQLSAFHARVEALKAAEVSWTARCADRTYDAIGTSSLQR